MKRWTVSFLFSFSIPSVSLRKGEPNISDGSRSCVSHTGTVSTGRGRRGPCVSPECFVIDDVLHPEWVFSCTHLYLLLYKTLQVKSKITSRQYIIGLLDSTKVNLKTLVLP